jgi:hypothetical protein
MIQDFSIERLKMMSEGEGPWISQLQLVVVVKCI